MGNLITTTAGFALASRGHFDLFLFLTMFTGLGLVIASACVFNNYIDREADQKMERTKNRALVQGLISGRSAIVFATLLALSGFAMLAYYTNLLSVVVASVGFFIYVMMYSFWKYRTSLATLVGSIAGAIPPVVGYCAASGIFDMGAAILFIMLVLWQMPHFFSIAVYRQNDYNAAGIPVLPTEKGMDATKRQMLYYIIAFIFSEVALIAFGYAGYAYLAVAGILGLAWLFLCIQGFKRTDDIVWAKSMFRLSLIVITLLSIMISFDTV